MSKTNLLALLRTFTNARQHLHCKGQPHGSAYICIAITRGTNRRLPRVKAQRIVMASIAPHLTFDEWLRANNPGMRFPYARVQHLRFQFIDACIAEINRRLKA